MEDEYDNGMYLLEEDETNTDLSGFLSLNDDEKEKLHPNHWKIHWKGMPEYDQKKNKNHYKTLYVHFRSEEDYQEFAELIGQKLTEKTKAIWHPKLEVEKNSLLRWVVEDD